MVPNTTRTVYFCVDCEASGPVPGLYNMVSVAGVVVRASEDGYKRGRSFYFEIIPEFDGFEEEAMSIHGLTVEHLKANGLPAREVCQRIADFVKEELQPGEHPLFVGHNAPFDWMFVAWYFAWAKMKNPFGYNALDTKSMMMGCHGLPWKHCSKPELVELYPELHEPDNAHDALADATFQADILIALLKNSGKN